MLKQTVAAQTRDWNYFKVKGLEFSLNAFNQKMYTTKTANEWMFQGYADPMISTAKMIGLADLPFDKFGWFYEV